MEQSDARVTLVDALHQKLAHLVWNVDLSEGGREGMGGVLTGVSVGGREGIRFGSGDNRRRNGGGRAGLWTAVEVWLDKPMWRCRWGSGSARTCAGGGGGGGGMVGSWCSRGAGGEVSPLRTIHDVLSQDTRRSAFLLLVGHCVVVGRHVQKVKVLVGKFFFEKFMEELACAWVSEDLPGVMRGVE